MNEANLVNDRDRASVRQFDAHSGCRSFRENLSALIDGELAVEQQCLHEEHAASCPLCESLLSQTVTMLKTAATLAERPIPQAVSDRLRKRLQLEGFRPVSRNKVVQLKKL